MNKSLPLLAGGAALHLGYSLFPSEHQALAWNAAGAAARLALVVWLVSPIAAPITAAVVAWIAAEEAQVIVCNTAFAFKPWPVVPGQEMCSSLIGTDLGKYSAAAVMMIIACLPTKVGRLE